MKFKNIRITVFLLVVMIFLIIVNIGLNISGPARYEEKKDEQVLLKVQSRFPLIKSLYRHSFQYVTYSCISQNQAYIFDYEGSLVVDKDFDENMLERARQLAFDDFGIEADQVHIGYGYENAVFVIEEADASVYYDYDSYEVVFYVRGEA